MKDSFPGFRILNWLRLLQNLLEMNTVLGRSTSVKVVLLIESVVTSVFVSFPQIRSCFGHT
ncbi:MAG: hypothetical protein V1754_06090, partial [Pseudomonadota bacterium]